MTESSSYETEDVKEDRNEQHAPAVDLGVNNLITAVTNGGKSFIIGGRRLKSVNQWYNKENARLQSIRDRQKHGKKITGKQARLIRNRNTRVSDHISKAAAYVIRCCVSGDIGTLVLGYDGTIQSRPDPGRINNQNFVNIMILKSSAFLIIIQPPAESHHPARRSLLSSFSRFLSR